ncbi:MFS general substrate transporter [Aulographum hederae CBS 113979]|uniref:MFS general substrate transporter n=1 Tax=Aulographum hederae CBS 113979 TaxID=1176131 RepID=A0A6G1GML3_9PEZI|nr:MFS general substrate transporter [Aulographum hederae CBS 113979]
MFIVFRFVAGAGSWGFLALIPLYVAEISPPKLRGLMVGIGGIGITTGYAIASYMGLAFNLSLEGHDEAQWRGPLGLQCVFPLFMLLILPILPESPRWLLMKGHAEKAREIVMRIHSIPDDPDQEYPRSEFYQMQKQAEHDKKLEPTWLEMFTKPSYRKRTMLGCLFAFLGQSTAVLVINNYGPTLYQALGYDVKDRLILQAGWVTVGLPANALGAFIVDRVGRKPLMTFSLAASCACLIVEAAMIATYASPVPAENPNYAGLKTGVAAFYIFLAVYSVGVDVCGNVYYSEIFPSHVRSKGVALAQTSLALTDLVYLQATTTAFANIGWKFFLVFIIISGLGAPLWYFIAPETKGVPLEEMASIFGETTEVAIYARDVHVDHNTHDLVVDKDDEEGHIARVATEGGAGMKNRVERLHMEDAEKTV